MKKEPEKTDWDDSFNTPEYLERRQWVGSELKKALELAQSFPKKTYTTGQTIIEYENKNVSVGFVHEGYVKCVKHHLYGKKQGRYTYAVFSDHQWFGVEDLGLPVNVHSFEAMTDCMVSLFPIEEFLQHMSGFHFHALCQYAKVFGMAGDHHMARYEGLKARLLILLIDLGSRTKRPELELTLQDIADLIGASKTKISPLLKELEEGGFVERGYKTYVVPDVHKAIEAIKQSDF